jgi:MoaA/NifB/PqqE/SkfB family radical SAM enzyme
MTFCYTPWTNVDISPTGVIAPCCKFQTQHYTEHFNIQTHTLKEYSDSEFLKKVKQEFNQGKWPQGCERCKIEEQNSIKSKRNLDFDRWNENYTSVDLDNPTVITASIAFGNTCNLKCISCNSYSSSRWQKEQQHIYGVSVSHVKFYKEDFVKDFVKQAPNLIHLDIPGGEPFLSGVSEQHQLLQHYIDSGLAGNVSLHYTTNGTIFPDSTWWDKWKHFKEIDIQLSIDGVGDRYEYIRYPASWDNLVTNTCRYIEYQHLLNNIKLSVSHTVSAYNIFYLDEFFSWCYNIGLPRPWLGRVHNPAHMRPTVWGNDAKQKIINKLIQSSHTDVNNWAKLMSQNDDSDLFGQFQQRLHQHDQYRNTNFAKTFPEMAHYI